MISSETAESVLSPTPTLLCCLEMEISILVVERTVVLEMPIKETVVTLLCSFYVFNIGYPKGFNRFFNALEVLLLDMNVKIDPKVIIGIMYTANNKNIMILVE